MGICISLRKNKNQNQNQKDEETKLIKMNLEDNMKSILDKAQTNNENTNNDEEIGQKQSKNEFNNDKKIITLYYFIIN